MPSIRFLKSYDGAFVSHDVGQLQELEYSILSHCWLDNEEVSYAQWRNAASLRNVKNRPSGFTKVAKFMDLSLRAGYDICWSDTCCINKNNSRELEITIGSMWELYKNANFCCVYLYDFYGDLVSIEMDGGKHFKKSRWFTRGWTLQELLAPLNVYFYNADWEYIGDKTSLARFISDRTRIPVALLKEEKELHQFSVAQKMSWAADRDTHEPADRAYSLMGLFGVNIVPNYADGIHAFRKLQEAILKDVNDESIFAWTQHGPWVPLSSGEIGPHPVCSLFAASPDCFRQAKHILEGVNEDALPAVYSSNRETHDRLRVPRIYNSHIEIHHNRLQLCCYVRRLSKFSYDQEDGVVLLEALLQCHSAEIESYGMSILLVATRSDFSSKDFGDKDNPLLVRRVEPYALSDANFPSSWQSNLSSKAKHWVRTYLDFSPTWPDEGGYKVRDGRRGPWREDDKEARFLSKQRMTEIREEFEQSQSDVNRTQLAKKVLGGVGVGLGVLATVKGARFLMDKYEDRQQDKEDLAWEREWVRNEARRRTRSEDGRGRHRSSPSVWSE